MKSKKKYISLFILSAVFIFGSFAVLNSLYNIFVPLEIVNVNLNSGIIDAGKVNEINLKLNRSTKNLTFFVNGKEQKAKVDNKIATIKDVNLCPGKNYTVSVTSKSILGYKVTSSYNFETAAIDEEMWVEVVKEPVNKVNVYKNGEVIKVMIASLGMDESETPSGTFRIQNRGESFFSEKYDEGAKYWVRFKDNYLFHSIPYDKNDNLLEEEVLKLGTCSSHGCVRLFLDDAKWLYENVPDNTLVVIN